MLEYIKYKKHAIHWIKYATIEHYRKTVDKICQIIANKKPKTILDIGCGDGLFCKKLARMGIAIRGIDISLDAIKHCKAHSFYKVDHCSIENYESKKIYEYLLLFDVLEHLNNPENIIKNLYKLGKYTWVLNPYPINSVFHNKEWYPEELINIFIKYNAILIKRYEIVCGMKKTLLLFKL